MAARQSAAATRGMSGSCGGPLVSIFGPRDEVFIERYAVAVTEILQAPQLVWWKAFADPILDTARRNAATLRRKRIAFAHRSVWDETADPFAASIGLAHAPVVTNFVTDVNPRSAGIARHVFREEVMPDRILVEVRMRKPDSSANVGARIRALRKFLKLTQADIGEITGQLPRKVSAWENGAQRAPFSAAIALKEHCGVTLDWIYANDFSSLPHEMREPLRRLLRESREELGLPE